MARSSCFSFDDGKEYCTFREISSPDYFETTHWCATCVVVAASSYSVFKHVRGRGMFFLGLRGAVHRIRTRHYNSTLHDLHFICESSKFLSGWEMPKSRGS